MLDGYQTGAHPHASDLHHHAGRGGQVVVDRNRYSVLGMATENSTVSPIMGQLNFSLWGQVVDLVDRLDQRGVHGRADGGDIEIHSRNGCVWVSEGGQGLVKREMI